MTQDRFVRARLLVEQSRYDLAEKEIVARLAEEPDDAEGLLLLAICQNALNRPEAYDTARRALELAPDDDRAHFVLSLTELRRHNYAEAEAAIRRAISLNSWSAGYFGQLSAIHLVQYQWTDALKAADEGLALDPDEDVCLNNRAMALTRLGRHDEAADTLKGTLEKHPEDSYTHANRGWSLLHENDPKQANVHFREALRLDPNSAWAKQGLLESLRARSWFYRRFLQFIFWLSRFPPRVRFGLLIGLVILAQVIAWLDQQIPALTPLWITLLIGYAVFAVMTWTARHLQNVVLLFDPDGRRILDRSEKWISLIVVALFALTLVVAVAGFVTDNDLLSEAWLVLLIVAVHFTSVNEIPTGRYRWYGAAASAAVVLFSLWVATQRLDLLAEEQAFQRDAQDFDDRTEARRRAAKPQAKSEAEEEQLKREFAALGARTQLLKGRIEDMKNNQAMRNVLSIGTLVLHVILAVRARRETFSLS